MIIGWGKMWNSDSIQIEMEYPIASKCDWENLTLSRTKIYCARDVKFQSWNTAFIFWSLDFLKNKSVKRSIFQNYTNEKKTTDSTFCCHIYLQFTRKKGNYLTIKIIL